MAFEKQFQKFVDNYNTDKRYSYSGFRVGDFCKLKKTSLDGASEGYLNKLKEIQESDLNLRITEVHSERWDVTSAPDTPDHFRISIAQELASGLFVNHITVSPDMIELSEWKLPNSWKAPGYDES